MHSQNQDPITSGEDVGLRLSRAGRAHGDDERAATVPADHSDEGLAKTVRGRAMRVIVVHDDVRWGHLIVDQLKSDEVEATLISDPEVALSVIHADPPDVVLLDLTSPSRADFDLLGRLRPRFGGVILAQVARASVDDERLRRELGVDDFTARPLEAGDLLARTRRAGQRRRDERVVVGSLEVDLMSREARFRGTPIVLTPVEFDLLAILARRAGHTVHRVRLLEAVRGPPGDADHTTLGIRIASLRKKLTRVGAPGDLLMCVPRVGYLLTAE